MWFEYGADWAPSPGGYRWKGLFNMRIDRLAVAAAALVVSTVLVSCSSDNNTTPSTGSIGVTGSVPSVDTTPVAVTTTP
jgi:hypothetical protein